MKNTIKLLGIIALAAIIGFAFLACVGEPDEEEDTNLKGDVTITHAGTKDVNEAVPTGTVLTADYTGSEDVTYQWKKDGTEVGTEETCTATEQGSYTVTVSYTGKTSKTSAAVTVAVYFHYIGSWESAAGNGRTYVMTYTMGNATITYVDTDSTVGKWTLTFPATGWTKNTTMPTISGYTADIAAYTDGWKVTGTLSGVENYPGLTNGNSYTQAIYFNAAKTQFILANSTGALVTDGGQGGATTVPRVFTKK